MATNRIWATVTPDTLAWVSEFGKLTLQARGSAAGSIITTFRDLMRLELRRVPLTTSEADCLADILGSSTLLASPALGSIVYAEVSSAFQIAKQTPGASYGADHDIDEQALLDKLRGLGPAADLALRIAFARWWVLPAEERDYRMVGLNIIDD